MKNYFLLVLLISILNSSYSQNKETNSYHTKISYKLIYKPSTIKDDTKEEFFSLYIGDKRTEFISQNKRTKDSLTTYKDPTMSFETFTSLSSKTEFHYRIINELTNDQIYYIDNFINSDIGYKEVIPNNWTTTPDKVTYLNYKCQKATIAYGGRTFVALFAPEIPLPYGPYKFFGLPGLILELKDTENDYVFQFKGLEKLNPHVAIDYNTVRAEITSKEKFLKTEKRLNSNFLDLISQAGMSLDLTNEQKTQMLQEQAETNKKKDNSIERKN